MAKKEKPEQQVEEAKVIEKKFVFDIRKVELKDLDGESFRKTIEESLGKPFHKDFGNKLYLTCLDLDLMSKAKKIHRNKVVDLTEEEAEAFRTFVTTKKYYSNLINHQILEQLIEVK